MFGKFVILAVGADGSPEETSGYSEACVNDVTIGNFLLKSKLPKDTPFHYLSKSD